MEQEIEAARAILRAVGADKNYAEVVACPTCGRCDYDAASLAAKITKATQNVQKPIKIAVMGCVVNGPGEAKDADIGIAGAKDGCVIFRAGEIVKKVPMNEIVDELMKMAREL